MRHEREVASRALRVIESMMQDFVAKPLYMVDSSGTPGFVRNKQ